MALKPRTKKLLAAAAAVSLVGGGILYTKRLDLGVGFVIRPPSPSYAPIAVPPDARAIEIERNGATVRAWVIEPQTESRGTIFVLHGIRDNKTSQLERGRDYARRGLTAVLVDSRGHGESSGRHLTYGVEESQDLVVLTNALEEEGFLSAPLLVHGTSYGAATAVQFAAREPRVVRTIAVAPFASLPKVAAAYIEWIAGSTLASFSGGLLSDVMHESAERASFDPESACPECVAPHIFGDLRIVHSHADERIPVEHGQAVAAAAEGSKDVELVLIDGVSHNETGAHPETVQAINRWVEELITR